MARTVRDEIDELAARNTRPLALAIDRLARANLSRDSNRIDRALVALGDIIAGTMATADMLGRRRTLLLVDKFEGRKVQLSASRYDAVNDAIKMLPERPALTIPRVDPQDAIADLVSRDIRLGASAEQVATVYSSDRGFALARSMQDIIGDRIDRRIESAIIRTGKARDAIVQSLLTGSRSDEAIEIIQSIGDFSRSYSETVYRTNLTTAYSAGTFRMMQDPNVRAAAPGLQYDAINDSDVRRGRKEDRGENHLALDGMTGAPDDPAWNLFSPPLGYNCRCSISPVPRSVMVRRGLVDSAGNIKAIRVPGNARGNPRFRNRPDAMIYDMRGGPNTFQSHHDPLIEINFHFLSC